MQILGICTDSTEEHADLDLHSFSCVAWGLQTHEVQPREEMQSIQIINNLKMSKNKINNKHKQPKIRIKKRRI